MAKVTVKVNIQYRWWFWPLYVYPLQFAASAVRALGFEPDLNQDRIEHWIKRGTILRIGNRVVPWT
jgi:hypothetical protein